MSENNQFQPYRYPQPEVPRPALNISATRPASRVPQSGFSALMKRPVIATAALLISAGVFAAILAVSYPDGETPVQNVPIIQADATPIKQVPDARGGMTIANADSTIFQQMAANELGERPPVENLLALEEPIAKDSEEFTKQAKAVMPDQITPTDPNESDGSGVQVDNTTDVQILASNDAPPPAAPPANKLSAPSSAPSSAAPVLHAPASSPETLAFVRSVLDKKDGKSPAASARIAAAPVETSEQAAAIQPAAGASNTVASAIEPKGTYFVQLASITAPERAEKEWGKLQASFTPQLSGAGHRVSRADLGERGVYYRIQAGPFSKEKASQVCEAIKAQKPGGCLVVQ